MTEGCQRRGPEGAGESAAMITGEVTIARLLEEHPELLDVLVGVHPHFKQFRNPSLRRFMAPRVTLTQAARIAGVPVEELLGALRQALGGPPGPAPPGQSSSTAVRALDPPDPRPAALAAVPESRQVGLDVREDVRRGEEPFARIMATVKGLRDEEVLVLRVPFEPVPLYGVLEKRGFRHWAERVGAEEWAVWFYREPGRAGAVRAPGEPDERASTPTEVIRLDVRGLEPPGPMVRILERLETLGPQQVLEVLHDRRPMFLYPQLEERGFVHTTEEPGPGLVRIIIRRGPAVG